MRQKKIIWFAIVLASFIYAVIVWMLAKNWPQPGPFDEAVRHEMVLMLYAVAVVTFVMALFIPRIMSANAPKYIVALALFESVVIYGLLAAFLRQDWRLFVPTWILGLIGFATRWPSDTAEEEQNPA